MSAQKDCSDSPERGLKILRDLVAPDKLHFSAGTASRSGGAGRISASPLRVVCLDFGEIAEQ